MRLKLQGAILLWLVAAILAVLSPAIAQRSRPTPRELWDARGSDSYTMVVEVVPLPSPPVGLELIVVDDEITSYVNLACERPSNQYLARHCEGSQYSVNFAMITIEDLFTEAESCIERTQATLSN